MRKLLVGLLLAACATLAFAANTKFNPFTGNPDYLGSSSGGGGSASLEIIAGGVQITTPTATIIFISPFKGFSPATSSATIQIDSITANGVLINSSATATYLQISSALATYLQNTSATVTYLQITSATVTYLQNTSATATYLQLTSATATYLQKSSATAFYLLITSAASTYPPLSAGLIPNTYIDVSSITKGGPLIAGTNITLSVGAGGTTINGSASGGGGDNLGTHTATKTLDMNSFPLTKVSSADFNGAGQNFVIQSTSSVNNAVFGAGGSSITVSNSSVTVTATSGLALNGLGIFYSTATGISLDAYRIQAGTGTVATNSTLTVTPPNCGVVNIPVIVQADGASTLGLELNAQTYNGTSFAVKNTDVAAAHSFNWWVFCK